MYHSRIEAGKSSSWLSWGWKWLAMFLNALPATTATACALQAFLKAETHFETHLLFLCMHAVYWGSCALRWLAGFCASQDIWVTLSQFKKILDVISRCFWPAKEQGNKMQSEAVDNLQNYLMKKSTSRNQRGRRAVPCPTTAIGRVVLVKIKTPYWHWASRVIGTELFVFERQSNLQSKGPAGIQAPISPFFFPHAYPVERHGVFVMFPA
jgi:hypothetical protein